MGLVFWSGVALGRLYSGDVTLQEDHCLVTGGPYRYVRHPRYAGAILLAFGLALTLNSWIGLVASVAFIAVILLRIRDEEALMGEDLCFGCFACLNYCPEQAIQVKSTRYLITSRLRWARPRT
jgi:protein-S-isoprenylcysteine O-methyltransferase Ste14